MPRGPSCVCIGCCKFICARSGPVTPATSTSKSLRISRSPQPKSIARATRAARTHCTCNSRLRLEAVERAVERGTTSTRRPLHLLRTGTRCAGQWPPWAAWASLDPQSGTRSRRRSRAPWRPDGTPDPASGRRAQRTAPRAGAPCSHGGPSASRRESPPVLGGSRTSAALSRSRPPRASPRARRQHERPSVRLAWLHHLTMLLRPGLHRVGPCLHASALRVAQHSPRLDRGREHRPVRFPHRTVCRLEVYLDRARVRLRGIGRLLERLHVRVRVRFRRLSGVPSGVTQCGEPRNLVGSEDRKSTRLNSSHLVISYAVFCLKKK